MTVPLQRTPRCVADFMTRQAHSVGADQTLALAEDRMMKLRVQHMPVLHGGRLVGILNSRDIALIRSVAADRLGRSTVEEAMTAVPYCVTAEARVAEVARHMASRKLDSAVVVDSNGNVEGVFTSTHALEILADLLDQSMPAVEAGGRVRSISVARR